MLRDVLRDKLRDELRDELRDKLRDVLRYVLRDELRDAQRVTTACRCALGKKPSTVRPPHLTMLCESCRSALLRTDILEGRTDPLVPSARPALEICNVYAEPLYPNNFCHFLTHGSPMGHLGKRTLNSMHFALNQCNLSRSL